MSRPDWLEPALDYVQRWLDFQMETTRQPGVSLAVAHAGTPVLECAVGTADASTGEALTPRHRFRVASHSKSFTAAAVMRLRADGKLRLDDPAGRWIEGLHPAVAAASVADLLSHGAGLVRDGADAGQWQMRRPFRSREEVLADLAEAPVLGRAERLKYSNHGYALAGLIVEAAAGEPYADYVRRAVVEPAGLGETQPDGPPAAGVPFACGHSRWEPLGRRAAIRADMACGAMAAAGGFVSTAGDLARFYSLLDPEAESPLLDAASRREMARPVYPEAHSSLGRSYALGLMTGRIGAWDWLGHGGSFPGTLSFSFALRGTGLAVSVLTNALDGKANLWAPAVARILQAFAARGAPSATTRGWSGQWWSLWMPHDLVAFADHVAVALPEQLDPFLDASEIAPDPADPDRGTIRLAGSLGNHGEPARLERDTDGAVRAVWLGGMELKSRSALARDLRDRWPLAPD